MPISSTQSYEQNRLITQLESYLEKEPEQKEGSDYQKYFAPAPQRTEKWAPVHETSVGPVPYSTGGKEQGSTVSTVNSLQAGISEICSSYLSPFQTNEQLQPKQQSSSATNEYYIPSGRRIEDKPKINNLGKRVSNFSNPASKSSKISDEKNIIDLMQTEPTNQGVVYFQGADRELVSENVPNVWKNLTLDDIKKKIEDNKKKRPSKKFDSNSYDRKAGVPQPLTFEFSVRPSASDDRSQKKMQSMTSVIMPNDD